MEENTNNRSLGWSTDKLLAVFGWLLADADFARGAGAEIQPEWFGTETALVKARMVQLKHLEKYGVFPTPDEVKDGPCLRGHPEDEKLLIARGVDLALRSRERFGKDGLADEVRRWRKSLIFRDAHKRSAQHYHLGQEEQAYSVMEDMVAAVRAADNEDGGGFQWEQFRQHLADKKAEYRGALTWGHPLFDAKLCPEGEGGCLLRGKSTLIESGTNRGKSRCLSTVVKSNLFREVRGQLAPADVLWITHEDPDVDLSMNLWCSTLRVTPGELLRFHLTPEGAAAMDELALYFKRHVELVMLPPTGLTVEKVVAVVRKKQEEWKRKHGKGFDLLVDDYPAKLTTDRFRSSDKRDVIAHVYQQFIGLALEYRFHSLLAVQSNRAGHVVGKGGGGPKEKPRWMDERDIAETFDPARDVANFISLNRTAALEAIKATVYYVCKAKESAAIGWAIACRGDYGMSLTHAPDMAATCFQADWMEADKIAEYLKTYDGKAVPTHIVGI